jgi:uncharacterized protein YndB with AHSA1/START domain
LHDSEEDGVGDSTSVDTAVHREIDLAAAVADVWEAVTRPELLGDWLDADVDVDLHPGGEGRVRDADGERRLRVEEVDDGRRFTFSWWPVDDVEATSRVELELLPLDTGTRLIVTETGTAPRACASTVTGWQCRLDVLAQVLAALVRV